METDPKKLTIQRLENESDIDLLLEGDVVEVNEFGLMHFKPSMCVDIDHEYHFIQRGKLPVRVLIVKRENISLNNGTINVSEYRRTELCGTYNHTDEIYFGRRLIA